MQNNILLFLKENATKLKYIDHIFKQKKNKSYNNFRNPILSRLLFSKFNQFCVFLLIQTFLQKKKIKFAHNVIKNTEINSNSIAFYLKLNLLQSSILSTHSQFLPISLLIDDTKLSMYFQLEHYY